MVIARDMICMIEDEDDVQRNSHRRIFPRYFVIIFADVRIDTN